METKREKIQANEVAAPTLIVGVGGTGCKIVKKVADLCQDKEKEKLSGEEWKKSKIHLGIPIFISMYVIRIFW